MPLHLCGLKGLTKTARKDFFEDMKARLDEKNIGFSADERTKCFTGLYWKDAKGKKIPPSNEFYLGALIDLFTQTEVELDNEKKYRRTKARQQELAEYRRGTN